MRQSLVVRLVLMLVIAVLIVFALLLGTIPLQQVQHLLYDSLKGSTQVLAAVGFFQWRHMDEGRVALPPVQRHVVGVVTQIAGKGQRMVIRLCKVCIIMFLLFQLN